MIAPVIHRAWAMPSSHTFSIRPISELLDRYLHGVIVDPFCGGSSRGTITNDIDPAVEAMYHMDATDFLRMLPEESADVVLYDPPRIQRGR